MKKKPIVQTTISPSDLTFLWSECKRCFWLKYNKGVIRPMSLPLVGTAAALQEREYRNKSTIEISSDLPTGVVTSWGGTVESRPIKFGGQDSHWRIKGKYDIVTTFEDGRVGIIDCKVTTGDIDDSKVDFYRPQLEAYAFALENPLVGLGKVVSETGLLMWKVSGSTGNPNIGYSFTTENRYISAGRAIKKFEARMNEMIEILEDEIPEAEIKCRYCMYTKSRFLSEWEWS